MDKLIDRLLKFFENKSIHFGLRTSIFIISIFIFAICDYYFEITYDIHLNNKIEKLESINNLKEIYQTDSLKLTELTLLEKRIYKRTHYSDRLRNLDLNQINIFKKSDTTEIKSPVIKNNNTIIKNSIPSLFWMVLTSNYIFIIIVITLFVLPFTGSVHRETKNLLGAIAAIIIFIGIIAMVTWIAYKMNSVWNNPTWTYIANILIHPISLILIGKLLNTKKKKN